MTNSETLDVRSHEDPQEATLKLIRNALENLQFGYVTAIVQDGVVVQIERTEKRRVNRKKS
jgi:hypothetical protein